MNRHGYHNEHEYGEGDAEEGNVEMPLPTYEEVVGASNLTAPKDALLRPYPSHSRVCCSPGMTEEETLRQLDLVEAQMDRITVTSYDRPKYCGKSCLLGVTGIVLIPLLLLLIVLQLKSCRSCPQHLDDSKNAHYYMKEITTCNGNLQNLQSQYNDITDELQNVKKERSELLKRQQSMHAEIRDLLSQKNNALTDATNLHREVKQLHEEIEQLDKLLMGNAKKKLNEHQTEINPSSSSPDSLFIDY